MFTLMMIFQSRLYLGYISFAVPFTEEDGTKTTKVHGGALAYYKPVVLFALCIVASSFITRLSERLMNKYELTEKLLESTDQQLADYHKLYSSRFKTMKEIEDELSLRNTTNYLKNLG